MSDSFDGAASGDAPEGPSALCATSMTIKSDQREVLIALLLSKPEVTQAMKEVVSALNDLSVADYNYRREATRLLTREVKHGPPQLTNPNEREDERKRRAALLPDTKRNPAS